MSWAFVLGFSQVDGPDARRSIPSELVSQQAENHLVPILPVDEFMTTQHPLHSKAELLIEAHDLFVTGGGLAPDFVQVEKIEGIVGQQLEGAGPERLPPLCCISDEGGQPCRAVAVFDAIEGSISGVDIT